MKSRQLQTLWWDWIATGERLLRSLSEQSAALVTRNLTEVEKIQPELDTMLGRMAGIDDRAAAATQKLAEALGAEPTLRSIVAALPEAEAQQVSSIAKRVQACGLNVQDSLARNRKLIENELVYVNGTLALIAKVASETGGQFAAPIPETVLMDQVA